ncbi:MAG: pyridoxal-phosphate dependent enzyme [Saprospiraceae bacterium]
MQTISDLTRKMKLPSKVEPLFVSHPFDYDIYIMRDDLIHPFISGNKWRKLKYNLIHFLESNHDGIISVGGAFSNHLVALSAACYGLNIPCAGIVRSHKIHNTNPSLNVCRQFGMRLVPLSPNQYAGRYSDGFISDKTHFANAFFIPEGGSNNYHYKGCEQLINELDFVPDYIVLPIGTGGTAAALANVESQIKIIGISPFREGKVHIPYLNEIINPHKVIYDFALNGYGRYHKRIVEYINDFWSNYGIPLDPIYNAKGMMGFQALLENKQFPTGSKILYIHTGGLQGIAGFNMLHSKKISIQIPRHLYLPALDL